MSQEETTINFLTRLEQKANEARNYEINISQFELNPSAFNQRWLENKFYELDEERVLMSR